MGQRGRAATAGGRDGSTARRNSPATTEANSGEDEGDDEQLADPAADQVEERQAEQVVAEVAAELGDVTPDEPPWRNSSHSCQWSAGADADAPTTTGRRRSRRAASGGPGPSVRGSGGRAPPTSSSGTSPRRSTSHTIHRGRARVTATGDDARAGAWRRRCRPHRGVGDRLHHQRSRTTAANARRDRQRTNTPTAPATMPTWRRLRRSSQPTSGKRYRWIAGTAERYRRRRICVTLSTSSDVYASRSRASQRRPDSTTR